MPGSNPGGRLGEDMNGDPKTRDAIRALLAVESRTMDELASELGKAKQTIAFHFRALRQEGYEIEEVGRDPRTADRGLGPSRYRIEANQSPTVGEFNLADHWWAR